MTGVDVGLFIGKAAFAVVLLGLNIGGLLTWADRRMRTAIQDCIGPNRAVVFIPAAVAKGILLGPALLAAAGVAALYQLSPLDPVADAVARTSRVLLLGQLAILVTWVTGLVIAGLVRRSGAEGPIDEWFESLGDPRNWFYGGVAAHVVGFLAAGVLRGTPQGHQLKNLAYGVAPAVLVAAMLAGALYGVSKVGEEKVGLRLAGLLHPAADGVKTIFKEDIVPPGADKFLHGLAPIIAFFPALVVIAVIPFGDTLCFGIKQSGALDLSRVADFVPRDGVCTDGAVKLQALDLNVGILYFFAMAGTGIVGAALAGWASDNKFSLLGGLRAASQMVSYEVALGLTVVGAMMIYGTVRLDEMVLWQKQNAWGIFVQPLAAVLFFTAAVAESKRIPFDMPEGESEIVAGYYTEYSGMKFAMFFFSEYVAIVTSSALFVTLFLGGWSLPFLERDGVFLALGNTVLISERLSHVTVIVLGVLAFLGKTVLLCWFQLVVRWTLPRFRYDQLMGLGWRKLLPASLVNLLFTGVVVLMLQPLAASPALALAASLTDLVVVVVGVGLLVWLVRFILEPVDKRQLLATTSAQYAAADGGTREEPMQA